MFCGPETVDNNILLYTISILLYTETQRNEKINAKMLHAKIHEIFH